MEFTFNSQGDVSEYREQWLLGSEQEEDLTDEEVRELMANDDAYFNRRYDLLCDTVNNELKSLGTVRSLFYIEGENIGWQGKSGQRVVQLRNASELIDLLTPDGAWSVTVKSDDEALYMTFSHHDSPTGEPYTVTSIPSDAAEAWDEGGEQAALEAL